MNSDSCEKHFCKFQRIGIIWLNFVNLIHHTTRGIKIFKIEELRRSFEEEVPPSWTRALSVGRGHFLSRVGALKVSRGRITPRVRSSPPTDQLLFLQRPSTTMERISHLPTRLPPPIFPPRRIGSIEIPFIFRIDLFQNVQIQLDGVQKSLFLFSTLSYSLLLDNSEKSHLTLIIFNSSFIASRSYKLNDPETTLLRIAKEILNSQFSILRSS